MKKSNFVWTEPNKYKKNHIVKKYWNKSSFVEVLILKVVKLSKELIFVEWKYIDDNESKWKTVFKKSNLGNWKDHNSCSESIVDDVKFNPNKIVLKNK